MNPKQELDVFAAIEAASKAGDFGEVVELLLAGRDRGDYPQLVIRALASAVRFGKEAMLIQLHTNALPQ
jgi:hypothetical protein